MALSKKGRSPDSRDPSHSDGKVEAARKVVSNRICCPNEAMTIRKASRSSRVPALHVGLLEYTWRIIGEAPRR